MSFVQGLRFEYFMRRLGKSATLAERERIVRSLASLKLPENYLISRFNIEPLSKLLLSILGSTNDRDCQVYLLEGLLLAASETRLSAKHYLNKFLEDEENPFDVRRKVIESILATPPSLRMFLAAGRHLGLATEAFVCEALSVVLRAAHHAENPKLVSTALLASAHLVFPTLRNLELSRSFLVHPSPAVRSSAIVALTRCGAIGQTEALSQAVALAQRHGAASWARDTAETSAPFSSWWDSYDAYVWYPLKVANWEALRVTWDLIMCCIQSAETLNATIDELLSHGSMSVRSAAGIAMLYAPNSMRDRIMQTLLTLVDHQRDYRHGIRVAYVRIREGPSNLRGKLSLDQVLRSE